MKKIIHKSTLLTLLLVYTVFSTGIFISIHHCCLHCYEKVEKSHCGCSEHHDSELDAHFLKDKHHHCQDIRFFFKILDSYDKKDTSFSFSPYIQQVCFCHHCCKNKILYDSTLLHIVYKEFDDVPPFFTKQGRTFIELHQQQVLYA